MPESSHDDDAFREKICMGMYRGEIDPKIRNNPALHFLVSHV